jgi:death on curing protein
VTATPDSCLHLTVPVVMEIHGAVLEAFGGAAGVRDEGLLQSAVAAPQATFAGQSPFQNLPEIAAAYLYYLCRNHPFTDGNKRTAMTTAIVFLRLNGVEPARDSIEWEKLVLDVAASRLDRDGTTRRLKTLLRKRRPRTASRKRQKREPCRDS